MCAPCNVTLSRLAVGERVGRRGRSAHDSAGLSSVFIHTYIHNSEKKWDLAACRASERAQKAECTRYIHYSTLCTLNITGLQDSHPLVAEDLCRYRAGRCMGVTCTGWQGETSMFILKFYFIFCTCLINRQGPNLSTANQPVYMQDMESLYISGHSARAIAFSFARC